MAAAVLLNFGFVLSLEDSLPGQVKTATIVPHIHDALRNERFTDFRIDPGGYLDHVRDHSLPSLCGRLDTVEEQPHGPIALICAFVMQRYLLLRRIFCSCEYLIAQGSAGCRTIDVVKRFIGNAVYNALESLRVSQVEPSEQDAAVQRKIKLDCVSV